MSIISFQRYDINSSTKCTLKIFQLHLDLDNVSVSACFFFVQTTVNIMCVLHNMCTCAKFKVAIVWRLSLRFRPIIKTMTNTFTVIFWCWQWKSSLPTNRSMYVCNVHCIIFVLCMREMDLVWISMPIDAAAATAVATFIFIALFALRFLLFKLLSFFRPFFSRFHSFSL